MNLSVLFLGLLVIQAAAQTTAVPGGISSTLVTEGGFETPALPASPGYQ
jgi:hypothetical protein